MAVDKHKNIFINEWQQGIAQSAHVGFSKFVNMDIVSTPGVVKLSYATGAATVPASLVNAVVNFAIDVTNSRVWAQTTDNRTYWTAIGDYLNWTEINIGGYGGVGCGLVIWENCLFVMSSNVVNIMTLSGFIAYAGWKSLNTNTPAHFPFVSRDGVLYIADGTQVVKLKKVGATFDPATPATYQYTLGFLDTKTSSVTISCINEIGTYLAVGTFYGSSLTAGPKVADIFFWNSNLSADQFTTKTTIQESGINAMTADGGILYVQSGLVGNIYAVQPGYVFQATKIKSPQYLDFSNNYGAQVYTFPNAFKKHQNELIWGISYFNSTLNPRGLMSMILDGQLYPMSVKNLPSTGNDGSTGSAQILSLLSVDPDTILIGTSNGIDVVGKSVTGNGLRVQGYAGYVESPLYTVGTNLENVGYTKIGFVLAKKLTTGQGVRIKYRRLLSDSYTTIVSEIAPTGILDFAALGAVSSYTMPATLTDIETIQFRIELTSTTGTSPELKEVQLLV